LFLCMFIFWVYLPCMRENRHHFAYHVSICAFLFSLLHLVMVYQFVGFPHHLWKIPALIFV
jgi:hypothetical protein